MTTLNLSNNELVFFYWKDNIVFTAFIVSTFVTSMILFRIYILASLLPS